MEKETTMLAKIYFDGNQPKADEYAERLLALPKHISEPIKAILEKAERPCTKEFFAGCKDYDKITDEFVSANYEEISKNRAYSILRQIAPPSHDTHCYPLLWNPQADMTILELACCLTLDLKTAYHKLNTVLTYPALARHFKWVLEPDNRP